MSLSLLFISRLSADNRTLKTHPIREFKIVGGGILGALESYSAYLDAKKTGKTVRVTIYEKGDSFLRTNSASTNTSFNIVPSLTVDEILSVVPRGSELVEKLAILFSDPGGIRVDKENTRICRF